MLGELPIFSGLCVGYFCASVTDGVLTSLHGGILGDIIYILEHDLYNAPRFAAACDTPLLLRTSEAKVAKVGGRGNARAPYASLDTLHLSL